MTSFMIHHHDLKGTTFPFPNIYLHDHEEAKFVHLTESAENYYARKNRLATCIRKSSEIVLVKSSRVLEETYIDHLSTLVGKKIVCVGPLVQAPKVLDHDDDDVDEIIQWLGKKEPRSTVFVSFGSEYFLTKEEIQEVAKGLEQSGVNFIWVVRFPKGDNTNIHEILPENFVERTNGRGLVVEGWAPQVKILGHANTGGFVSHCGWSSVMEAIKYNVPIIGVPMHLDQPVNARLVKEMGVGVEVKRLKDGRLGAARIAKVVRAVVRQKAGLIARKKQREMGDMIRETEEEVLDDVVEELGKLWRMKHGIYHGILPN